MRENEVASSSRRRTGLEKEQIRTAFFFTGDDDRGHAFASSGARSKKNLGGDGNLCDESMNDRERDSEREE